MFLVLYYLLFLHLSGYYRYYKYVPEKKHILRTREGWRFPASGPVHIIFEKHKM